MLSNCWECPSATGFDCLPLSPARHLSDDDRAEALLARSRAQAWAIKGHCRRRDVFRIRLIHAKAFMVPHLDLVLASVCQALPVPFSAGGLHRAGTALVRTFCLVTG